MEDLKRVYIAKDDDGHTFLLPYEMRNEFRSDLEGLSDENIYEWDYKYNKFMIGGDINNIELYARI